MTSRDRETIREKNKLKIVRRWRTILFTIKLFITLQNRK